jgi:hypothetical protein
MSALKLQTLKQKLWAIVAASFIVRITVFFTLPNTPSFLGPDEGTYASMVKWVGESKPARDFPAYGQGLYLSGRSLIIPASALYRAGINELDSVRLIATVYGLSSLILIVLLALSTNKSQSDNFLAVSRKENLIATSILVFAFMPSHFLWSNLGLRESATEFWLISTFAVFYIIFHRDKEITFRHMLLLFVSLVLTFSARPQVGWVLATSLILYLLLKLKNFNSYFLIPIIMCAVLFGNTWNLGSTASLGIVETTETTETTDTTEILRPTKPPLSNLFNPLITAGEVVVYKQEVNQLDAASVIQAQSCPREKPALTSTPPTNFDTYFCIAWRAPYMVSTFLFRPILGVDVTSSSSLIAAIENIFWLGLFIAIFVLAIRRRTISFLRPILPAMIFFGLYVLGASAYQGNMGTGFRHKSLILWAVLLLISALAWRKPEDASIKHRNNSQESAV